MNELPKRKQLRIQGYDYSQNGYYFVTICTQNKRRLFGEIVVGADIIRPKLSEYGEIAETAIKAIPDHYSNVRVDRYVIMPDHVHMILIIMSDKENSNGQMISAPTIMTIIGQMKRWVSKRIGFPIWQKSYFEHIIRDERDYISKIEYISNNPVKWVFERNDTNSKSIDL